MFELNESAGLWTLFLSAFLSSTLLPGGSEAVLLYLASQTSQNLLLLGLVASIGNTLGGLTSFGLGWWLANRFPDKTLDEEKHQKALERIRRYGSPILLLSWAPVIGDPLCLVAGWLKLSFWKACLFIAIGKAARYGALLFIVAGAG